MGHHDVVEEGNKVVVGNEDSFKGFLSQGNIRSIDFEHRMKVEICVSFQNDVYPISHVLKFITDSICMDSWSHLLVILSQMHQFYAILKTCGMMHFYCMDNVEQCTEVIYDKVE
jgi:hypothetical protein